MKLIGGKIRKNIFFCSLLRSANMNCKILQLNFNLFTVRFYIHVVAYTDCGLLSYVSSGISTFFFLDSFILCTWVCLRYLNKSILSISLTSQIKNDDFLYLVSHWISNVVISQSDFEITMNFSTMLKQRQIFRERE